MRTMARTVSCPTCGRPATITLYEQIDPVGGTEGHQIEFSCSNSRHSLSEPDKLRLWAADRHSDLASD